MSAAAQFAAAELLRRQRSRTSLPEYSQAIEIPGVPVPGEADNDEEFDDPLDNAEDVELGDGTIVKGAGRLIDRIDRGNLIYSPIEERVALHHYVMMLAIQKCIQTSRGRLMIFAPPGSAKSTYASVIGTSWALGRKKNQQIILASYGSSIAAKQSRKVRTICKNPMWSSLWPTRPLLLDDQRAVDDWSLTNGSALMSAGLLAGITGNRADGVIIDDPVRNREEADSPTIREKIYNEYIDTVMTRAKPHMWCIIIQTRWHEDDLAGSILPAQYEGESGLIACRDGQKWEVLCIPAEAERDDDPLGRKVGDFLWPEWFPREHWDTWRNNTRAQRTWAALYQQRPAPFTGIHFQRDMFRYYDPRMPQE
jgi:hypothetical protein